MEFSASSSPSRTTLTLPLQTPSGFSISISYVAPRYGRVIFALVHPDGRHGPTRNPSNSGRAPGIRSHTTISVQAAVPVAQERDPPPGRSLSGPQMNWQATYGSTRRPLHPPASQRRKDAKTPGPLHLYTPAPLLPCSLAPLPPCPPAPLRLCVFACKPTAPRSRSAASHHAHLRNRTATYGFPGNSTVNRPSNVPSNGVIVISHVSMTSTLYRPPSGKRNVVRAGCRVPKYVG